MSLRIIRFPFKIFNVTQEIVCKIVDAEAKKYKCRVKWDKLKREFNFIGDVRHMKDIVAGIKEVFYDRKK